jgi:hypothetical protein
LHHASSPYGIVTSQYSYLNSIKFLSTDIDGPKVEMEKSDAKLNEKQRQQQQQQQQHQQLQPRRKRHVFRGKNIENLPSFHDFQLQMQIRQLYRKYVRLVWHSSTKRQQESATITTNGSATSRSPNMRRDMMATVKSEFRKSPHSDSWEIKRALSEGNRRYKELASMLSTTSMMNGTNNELSFTNGIVGADDENISLKNVWPWNNMKRSNEVPQRPLSFPPKSK